MAVVSELKPGTKLFVMETQMSSPFFTDRSENIDSENAKKLYYHFQAGDRKSIAAIRQHINVLKNNSCARFYGLYIANDLAKEQITEALTVADRAMKAIDPTLEAKGVFMELDTGALSSGNMLQIMTAQIQDQIYGVVFKEIEAKLQANDERGGGALSTKSKNALLNMLEKCKTINVIDDDNINAKIEAMKAQITSEAIIPLRDEIKALLSNSTDRFSSIDLMPAKDGEKVTEDEVTPDSPVHDPDDEVFDAKPVEDEPVKVKQNQSGSQIASRISIDDI